MNFSKELLNRILYFETKMSFRNYIIVLFFKEKNIFGFRKKLKIKYPYRIIENEKDFLKDVSRPLKEFDNDINFLKEYLNNIN